MLFGKPNILKCPLCGGLRRITGGEVFDCVSEVRWSDGYMPDYQPSISPVLLCPVCKRYHFYEHSQITGKCRTYRSFGHGYLSYKHLKESLAELAPTGKKEEKLRKMILWAYNDLYWDIADEEKQTDDYLAERKYFVQNAKALIELCRDDTLYCAELLREIGEFEECLNLLTTYHISTKLDCNYDSITIYNIAKLAMKKNSKIYLAVNDSGEILIYPEIKQANEYTRHPGVEDVGYVYSLLKDWDWEYIKERFDCVFRKIKERFHNDECDEY